MPAGRHSKLQPEARERFLRAISAGAFIEVAGRHAGWSRASTFRYLGADTPAGAALREDVAKTLADLELRLGGTLVKSGLSSGRFALATLERRFPQRWRAGALPEQLDEEPRAAKSAAIDDRVDLDDADVERLVAELLDAAARNRGGPALEPGDLSALEEGDGDEPAAPE